MSGSAREQAFAALRAAQQLTGQQQAVCRPLLRNVQNIAGATLTDCPICGEKCWKLDLEPDELPEGCMAMCTECALKAGVRRQGLPKPSSA